MQYKNLTTSLLIDKCISKDPLAWSEFVGRFEQLIYLSIKKAMARYLGEENPNLKDIDDIKQDILTAIWSNNMLNQIKNRESIAYWVSIVSRNITINFLKKNKKEILVDDMSFFDDIPQKFKTQNDRSEELQDKIKKIFNLLNTKEKLIFMLYFLQHLSLKDTAALLRIPLGTVTSITSRIRKKICSKL